MSQNASTEVIPHSKRSDLRLDWTRVIAIGALHVGCLFLLVPAWTFSWSGVAIFFVLWWIIGCLGITVGYHRLLTHRSFKTPKFVEYFLAICGCLTWQGGPIQWVGAHRLHHRDSDHAGDPHSPVVDGFAWSHVLWALYLDNPDFKPKEAAKDLTRDPIMAMIDNYFYVPQFILAAILFGAGYACGHFNLIHENGLKLGLSWFLWGVCLRTVVMYHGTWFVNSAAHTWGYRNFETNEGSRNNWWVAAISFGEGWHNNHHAFQRSAAHGLRWYEFDVTYLVIRTMGILGMATDIVVPEPEQLHVTRPTGKHTKIGTITTKTVAGDPSVASTRA